MKNKQQRRKTKDLKSQGRRWMMEGSPLSRFINKKKKFVPAVENFGLRRFRGQWPIRAHRQHMRTVICSLDHVACGWRILRHNKAERPVAA